MAKTSLDIGIPTAARKEIVNGLEIVLADTYTLYLKTHGYHWNVTGPMFQTLHLMFETQYNELWLAVDQIAERIRSLGHFVPVGNQAFDELSNVEDGKAKDAKPMIADLVKGHELVAKDIRSMWDAAEEGKDQATLDMITQRLAVHEKTAWMLRSLLA